jgi:hypothetical protein
MWLVPGKQDINYLGHIVNEQGINTDPEKVKAIAERHEPQSVKEVHSLLGMMCYTIVAKSLNMRTWQLCYLPLLQSIVNGFGDQKNEWL